MNCSNSCVHVSVHARLHTNAFTNFEKEVSTNVRINLTETKDDIAGYLEKILHQRKLERMEKSII